MGVEVEVEYFCSATGVVEKLVKETLGVVAVKVVVVVVAEQETRVVERRFW